MILSEEKTKKSYYLSCLEYVFGEPTSVPSPVRKHFRRQEESSSSLSSSGRSEARARQSGKPSIEHLVDWVIALEEMVFLNRQQRTEENRQQCTEENWQCTEVNVEDLWQHINFDEPVSFQTNQFFDNRLFSFR